MKEIRIEVDDEFWEILKPCLLRTKEIVLCNDCKYFGYEDDGDGISDSWCSRDDADFMSMSANDFCSRGEKNDT